MANLPESTLAFNLLVDGSELIDIDLIKTINEEIGERLINHTKNVNEMDKNSLIEKKGKTLNTLGEKRQLRLNLLAKARRKKKRNNIKVVTKRKGLKRRKT